MWASVTVYAVTVGAILQNLTPEAVRWFVFEAFFGESDSRSNMVVCSQTDSLSHTT